MNPSLAKNRPDGAVRGEEGAPGRKSKTDTRMNQQKEGGEGLSTTSFWKSRAAR